MISAWCIKAESSARTLTGMVSAVPHACNQLPCSASDVQTCKCMVILCAQLQLERLPPAVWAGLEFKVPSAAVSALPPFRCGSRSAGPSAMESLKAAAVQAGQQQEDCAEHQLGSKTLHAYTPAQPPPSRAETDEWLAQQQRALEGSQGSNSSRSRAGLPGEAPLASS